MTSPIALVPVPLRCEPLDGGPFVLGAATSVAVGDSPGEIAVGYVAADLLGRLGRCPIELLVGADGADVVDDVVVLRVRQRPGRPPGTGPTTGPAGADERYVLRVEPGRVTVDGASTTALVRGLATLVQLLAGGVGGAVGAPAVLVEDAPRYAWRGLCVDVPPEALDVDDLKVVVTLLAAYKLDVLHLRVPERGDGVDGGGAGGWCSTPAYAELVGFAELHGVTVVPEVDVLTPRAAGPRRDRSVRDAVAEVARATPGPWLHVGGRDVAPVATVDDLARIAEPVDAVVGSAHTVVGWAELAAVPLPRGSVLQHHDDARDPAPLVAAARAGVRVVLAPDAHARLDGPAGVRDCGAWDPAAHVPGLPAAAVLGVEAVVRTRDVRDLDELMALLLPRLAAVAEVGWSAPALHDWAGFRGRLAHHGVLWERAGLEWTPSPEVDWVPAEP
ncbi:family 20 glycosylhydrolase [Cellulomonas cellasea]|uniref:beta-N-acetylhexosaminidase n=1 Tax=Cellulomonas cellasea TaxID=43670 RepID=A0A7W4YCX9_9CELL|nr:family 20 glycosylhydrolase [Cellulomonas cellasea]MBB2923996.1 hexosaminidase [Cellulomonas cellasea]